ncbi:MAG: hypothetical protein M3Y34_02335 [Actinomycetota bacterium]|nr:hypothetical protein [Actinomycetota bacterium]
MTLLRDLQAKDDSRTEALRALGGLLLGIGGLVLLVRKSSFPIDAWEDFPLLLVWLIPALILYGGGIAAARAAQPRLWHSVWVVFGILFLYGTLLQFITLLDGDTGSSLNTLWTLCVVAAAGVGAALFAKVRFGWLIAGVALAIAWLALWDEILADGIGADAGTFRGLCMVAALLLIALACAIETRGREGAEAAELVTAAGLIFVVGAGLIGLSDLSSLVVAPDVTPTAGGVEPSLFWDLVLLGGSILLVAAGGLTQVRGPVYVGAAGILTFVLLVGVDLDDDTPEGKVLGWPLILLVAAALAIAASFAAARRSSSPPVGKADHAP